MTSPDPKPQAPRCDLAAFAARGAFRFAAGLPQLVAFAMAYGIVAARKGLTLAEALLIVYDSRVYAAWRE